MTGQKTWGEVLMSVYPDALKKTYCVPPIHFNRVHYVREMVAGQPALILQTGTHDVTPTLAETVAKSGNVDSVETVTSSQGTVSECAKITSESSGRYNVIPASTLTQSHIVTPTLTSASKVTPSHSLTPTSEVTPSHILTPASEVTPSHILTPASEVTPSHILTPASEVTQSHILTPASEVTPSHILTPASEVTQSHILTPASEVTPSHILTPASEVTPSHIATSSLTSASTFIPAVVMPSLIPPSIITPCQFATSALTPVSTTTSSDIVKPASTFTVNHVIGPVLSDSVTRTTSDDVITAIPPVCSDPVTNTTACHVIPPVYSDAVTNTTACHVIPPVNSDKITNTTACHVITPVHSDTATRTTSGQVINTLSNAVSCTAVTVSTNTGDANLVANVNNVSKYARKILSTQTTTDHSDCTQTSSSSDDQDHVASCARTSRRSRQSAENSPLQPFSLWTMELPRHWDAKPACVQSNNYQEDFAQNHLLVNLQELGSRLKEVMFILSQFSFDDYLKRAVKKGDSVNLPRPADLGQRYRRGDFDILIIHRHYGILVGELKSVGWNRELLGQSETEADAVIVGRIKTAVEQLEKSEKVIKHLLRDIADGLAIKKTLFLPYVSTTRLQAILDTHPQLRQMVADGLSADDGEEILHKIACCCSDQLSDRETYWEVSPDTLQRLTVWWQRSMTCTMEPLLSDQLYLEIVGRFVGPASSVSIHCVVPPRVEVRTEGEAVAELGRRLARLVLTPQQLDLLVNKAKPLVCVTGPPGTGKTVTLILMGLKWLLDGYDVHVLSTRPASLASSQVMYYQLDMTSKSYQTVSANVHFHHFDFYEDSEVDKAISALATAVHGDKLHILMEEAVFSDSCTELGPRYWKFISSLHSRVPCLHLWVARVRHDNIPDLLTTETLTTPLRSAPVVLREVRPGVESNNVHNYCSGSQVMMTAPSDGPNVRRLLHAGDGHRGAWPHQCPLCGHNLARLFQQLDIGAKERRKKISKFSPEPVSFKDVFVLTRASDLQDDIVDCAGTVTSPASGLVSGLRDEGIPLCVLPGRPCKSNPQKWTNDVIDTAMAQTDRVTVAHWRPVLGLERKVVVWLKGWSQEDDKKRSQKEVEDWDRVWVVSRCTTQLVIVDIPQ